MKYESGPDFMKDWNTAIENFKKEDENFTKTSKYVQE